MFFDHHEASLEKGQHFVHSQDMTVLISPTVRYQHTLSSMIDNHEVTAG
jgi:hypothetical protein